MTTLLKTLASATAICIASTAAHAAVVVPFASSLSAGENTLGIASVGAFTDFSNDTLSFIADTDLVALGSITVNPFATDVTGTPANSIAITYAVNGVAVTGVPITTSGSAGTAETSIALVSGDVLSYFINGVSGQSGNAVTIAIETAPVPVPAALLFGLSGMAAFGALRRKK